MVRNNGRHVYISNVEGSQNNYRQLPPARSCPRCLSGNTKFCYYNNYSLSQPRYFCSDCKRHWTHGGALRDVPVGSGCRKKKDSKFSGESSSSSEIVARLQSHVPVPCPRPPPDLHLCEVPISSEAVARLQSNVPVPCPSPFLHPCKVSGLTEIVVRAQAHVPVPCPRPVMHPCEVPRSIEVVSVAQAHVPVSCPHPVLDPYEVPRSTEVVSRAQAHVSVSCPHAVLRPYEVPRSTEVIARAHAHVPTPCPHPVLHPYEVPRSTGNCSQSLYPGGTPLTDFQSINLPRLSTDRIVPNMAIPKGTIIPHLRHPPQVPFEQRLNEEFDSVMAPWNTNFMDIGGASSSTATGGCFGDPFEVSSLNPDQLWPFDFDANNHQGFNPPQ